MDNINHSLVVLQPTPADAKSCNWYVSGGNVVIETIEQYLGRVSIKRRSPESDVTILLPKEGYESLGVYPIDEFKGGILSNFNGKKYAFVGGLENINFIQVGSIGFKVKIQYSVDGLTGWHSPATDADNYGRFSIDNGATWDAPFKFGKESSSGGGILLAENYNKDAVGGILLCSQYRII